MEQMERLEKMVKDKMDEFMKQKMPPYERQLKVTFPGQQEEPLPTSIYRIEVLTANGGGKTYFRKDAQSVYNAIERMEANGSNSTGPIMIDNGSCSVTFYQGHIAAIEVDYSVVEKL